MDDAWAERLFDTHVDLGIFSLIPIVLGLVLAVLAYHGWFRFRLEKAVRDNVGPSTVRIESVSAALMTFAFLAWFSKWGFAIIGVVLLFATILALASRGRLAIGVAIILTIGLVALTIFGLRL